jgi:hypothetical protein
MLNWAHGRYVRDAEQICPDTQEEFIDAFRGIERMPEGLILDLQGNGGGFLGAAVFLAEQFLQKGELVLFTEGGKMNRREIQASGMGFFVNTQVVVLIDERSPRQVRSCGSHSGLGPRNDSRTAFVWERPGTAIVPVERRFGNAPDRGKVPYPKRPGDPVSL